MYKAYVKIGALNQKARPYPPRVTNSRLYAIGRWLRQEPVEVL